MHSEPTSAHLFSCFDDEDCADSRAANPADANSRHPLGAALGRGTSVLFFSCGVLAEFAYCLAAEHTVARAARAGALEATLPRATSKSIAESVTQRLAGYPQHQRTNAARDSAEWQAVLGRLNVQPGDRISVHVAVPGTAVLPRWLQR